MCQGSDPNDLPIGYCVYCEIELFRGDLQKDNTLKCPECHRYDNTFDPSDLLPDPSDQE